ncbi:MAG TPA: translation elongation factor Ts [Candidatus Limnocylindrales bacterium]|nr:translation elongation factor Ts [Candidatus Limnocylindrales bacterium]
MANIDLKTLKKLRDETAASIVDCRVALDESGGDYKKALEWLKKRGIEKASKKSGRSTGEGLVEAYIHNGGKIGVLVTVNCETDFVAKTEEFKQLAHEVAMQISAMNPSSVEELLKQDNIRDSSITIDQLIKSAIGKLGENITIGDFKRFEI